MKKVIFLLAIPIVSIAIVHQQSASYWSTTDSPSSDSPITTEVERHAQKTFVDNHKKIENMEESDLKAETTEPNFSYIKNKTDLQQEIVQEEQRFKRHLPTNTPIASEKQDPITQRYAVDERTTLDPDKKVGMTVWSDAKYYLQTDTVQIYAQLMNKDQQVIPSHFSATLLQGQRSAIKDIAIEDENQDKIYEGAVTLSELQLEPGIYNIRITNTEYQVIDDISFTLSQPDIELTGEAKSFINDKGHLQWDIQVNVNQQSRYYIQGSLYSLTRVAISSSQNSFTLSPGKHWVSLEFDGGLIKESGENGPYIIKKMSLAKVTMPMQRAPLLEPDFQSQSYRLDEF